MLKSIAIVLVGFLVSWNAVSQGTTPDAKGTVQSVPAADILPVDDRNRVDTKAKGKLSDVEFVRKAAAAGLAEVRISNLALDKSTAKSVRDFANMMVKDHAAANQQLRAIAAAKELPMPQTLDQAHMDMVNNMVRLSGVEFDDAYVNIMKQDHDFAIALFENAAGDPELSKELRDFAIGTLEMLRNHQLQAHNLPAGETKLPR